MQEQVFGFVEPGYDGPLVVQDRRRYDHWTDQADPAGYYGTNMRDDHEPLRDPVTPLVERASGLSQMGFRGGARSRRRLLAIVHALKHAAGALRLNSPAGRGPGRRENFALHDRLFTAPAARMLSRPRNKNGRHRAAPEAPAKTETKFWAPPFARTFHPQAVVLGPAMENRRDAKGKNF